MTTCEEGRYKVVIFVDTYWYSPQETYWGAVILEPGKKPFITGGKTPEVNLPHIAETEGIKLARNTAYRRGKKRGDNITNWLLTIYNDSHKAIRGVKKGSNRKGGNKYYQLGRDNQLMEIAFQMAHWHMMYIRGITKFNKMPIPKYNMAALYETDKKAHDKLR